MKILFQAMILAMMGVTASANQVMKSCRPYYSHRYQKVYNPHTKAHFSLLFKFSQDRVQVDYISDSGNDLEEGEQVSLRLEEVKWAKNLSIQPPAPSFYNPVDDSIRNPQLDQHLKWPAGKRRYFHILMPIKKLTDKSVRASRAPNPNAFKYYVLNKRLLWISVNGDVTYVCR